MESQDVCAPFLLVRVFGVQLLEPFVRSSPFKGVRPMVRYCRRAKRQTLVPALKRLLASDKRRVRVCVAMCGVEKALLVCKTFH